MRLARSLSAALLTSATSAALASATLVSSSALASPQDVFGYGPRNTARGATGAADGAGAETTWSNPALLSLSRERELTLGFQAARLDLYARGGNLPGAMHPEPMHGSLIGAVLPIPFGGVLRERVALGLGFYTPTNVVVRGRVLYPEVPQFALLADRLQSVTVQLGLGADLGYGIRVGAGFSALAAISGTVLVATDTSGSVGTKVDDQLVASYGKIFGASYDLGDAYRVGLTYRSTLDARFSVTIDVRDLGTLVVPPFNIAGLAQYDPWQVALEIARVKGPWHVAVGATFKRWSGYPGAPEPTVICPPEHADCAALRPAAPGFHDTIVPRIGVERTLTSGSGYALVGRAGYFLEPSPAPAQTTEANGFDNTRHAFTFGYAVDLSSPLPPARLELFGQYHQLVSRTHVKDASVSSQNPGFPRATTGGHVLFAGLAGTVRF